MDKSRTKVTRRKRRISQTKIPNKTSDEEGGDADMESDSDNGYPKLVLVSKHYTTQPAPTELNTCYIGVPGVNPVLGALFV